LDARTVAELDEDDVRGAIKLRKCSETKVMIYEKL